MNTIGSTRQFQMTAEMHEECTKSGLYDEMSKLWNAIQVQMETERVLKRATKGKKPHMQLHRIFGFVPQLFGCMQEAPLLAGYTALLEGLFRADSMPFSLSLRCQILALTAYSFNCYYLTAVFTTLAAQ